MIKEKLFYDILDGNRRKVLPLLKSFKKDFYLAGGTALALQIGHRDSVDFDFFSQEPFLTSALFEKCLKVFGQHNLKKTQEEKGTLSIVVDKKIKLSFFEFGYKLIDKTLETENFVIASIADIGCMKLSAIVSRAVLKDYIDLFFIIKRTGLAKLLDLSVKKFPEIDTCLILKSLVYFEDLEETPIVFKHNSKIATDEIMDFFRRETKKLIRGAL